MEESFVFTWILQVRFFNPYKRTYSFIRNLRLLRVIVNLINQINLTLNFPTTRPSSSNSSTPCFPRYNSKVWSHSVKPSNSGWFSSSLGNTFIIATEAFDFFLCILGLKRRKFNILVQYFVQKTKTNSLYIWQSELRISSFSVNNITKNSWL